MVARRGMATTEGKDRGLPVYPSGVTVALQNPFGPHPGGAEADVAGPRLGRPA